MANSNFETTMKEGGKAIDEAAKKTGQQDEGVYEQAKSAASDAYDSAADAFSRVQDSATDLDDAVTEQVGRHPKAMVALGVGIGFALGMLFAASRTKEPGWRDYARW
jgi:ElaB/YqjD/DUF883 family membrane-anchored ribosome-binding protein